MDIPGYAAGLWSGIVRCDFKSTRRFECENLNSVNSLKGWTGHPRFSRLSVMATHCTAKRLTDADILATVKRYWGFEKLRPHQEQAILAGLEQRDSLVVLPTGGGKSLCYQRRRQFRGGPISSFRRLSR